MTSRFFGQDGSDPGGPGERAAPAPSAEAPDDAAKGEKRRALLVGNSRYAQGRLTNPVRDVRLVGKVLRSLGFETAILEDTDKRTLQNAVIDFCTALEATGPDTVALFYFAGHGIQHHGTNYLVPIEADIPSSRHLGVGALAVDDVVAELSRAPRKANVIVLDACRNNPLPQLASQSRDVTQGLAALRLTTDRMLVVYATAAGSLADDGDGDHSPYADALAQSLPGLLTPGRRIHDVFVEAADKVADATDGRQNPALFLQGSLPALVVTEKDRERLEEITKPPVVEPPWLKRWSRGQMLAAALGAAAISLAAFLLTRSEPPQPLGRLQAPSSAKPYGDTLWWHLAAEFPSSATPFGYVFHLVQPICCNDEKAGLSGLAQVRFKRKEHVASKGGDESWEGVTYHVFANANVAARFTLKDADALDYLKRMHGSDSSIQQRFNSGAWRGRSVVTLTSTSGTKTRLNCYVADTLIGCLVQSSNPRVVIQLMLQEPTLRGIATDGQRRATIENRVMKEGDWLLRAAEDHVAWAQRLATR